MKITTDLTGTESAATRHARIKSIYDWYFGTGAYVAAGNLGVARTALNVLLPSDIANGETFASWLVKLNWLNDLDTAIPALVYTGGYKGLTIDAEVLSSMSQDTAGATPVTAAGQPIGRILDRSGNALHLTQSTAAARPTYRLDGSSRPYLETDAIDDWMTSPSFAWGSDEVTVIAAFRKRADTPVGRPMSFGTPGVAGSFFMAAPGAASTDKYYFGARGSAAANFATTTNVAYNAPITAVFGGTAKISTDTLIARINGVDVATNATDHGTGNFGTSTFTIGAQSGPSIFAGIDLYGLLAVNRLLTTQERGWVEKWMALKSGVTLP